MGPQTHNGVSPYNHKGGEGVERGRHNHKKGRSSGEGPSQSSNLAHRPQVAAPHDLLPLVACVRDCNLGGFV